MVRGIDARVAPESSRLSCRQIREGIQGLPAESGAFGLGSPSLHGLWNCHLFLPAKNGVLLSCSRHGDRFSLVKR